MMEKSRKQTSEKREIQQAIIVIIIFIGAIAGREIGNFYASYEALEKLAVYFTVDEEELARYLVDILADEESELNVKLTIANAGVTNEGELVTATPDYVRRWLITVTLSPVTVIQPDVSDVMAQLYVEDQLTLSQNYTYQREKVTPLSLLDREISLQIDNITEFQETLYNAAEEYDGEVKITINGQVRAHLLFLETWLPFSVTRYPLVKPPFLRYVFSDWRDQNVNPADSIELGQSAYISVKFSNPTRFHSLQETVQCLIYREGSDEPVEVIEKLVSVAPSTEANYVFRFNSPPNGVYRYSVISLRGEIQSYPDSDVLNVS